LRTETSSGASSRKSTADYARSGARPEGPTKVAKVQQVVEEFVDDLDGTKAAQTVQFSFEGRDYVIDLSKKNATALGKVLVPYIEAGRRIPARRAGRTAAPKVAQPDLQGVRAWAAQNGIEVASRGRIPHSVLEQYTAATS
jgi:hypothetical protein